MQVFIAKASACVDTKRIHLILHCIIMCVCVCVSLSLSVYLCVCVRVVAKLWEMYYKLVSIVNLSRYLFLFIIAVIKLGLHCRVFPNMHHHLNVVVLNYGIVF